MSTGHEYYRDLLPEYVSGTLSAEMEREVRDHLADCARCRSDRATIESVFATLHEQTKMEVPPHYFSTILPRVRERLERRSQRSWMPGIFVTRFAAPLAALIVAVVLLARIPLNPASQEASLRSVVSSLNSEELADVLIGQTETQWSPTAEALSPLVSEKLVTSELAADLLRSDDVSSYQTVSDLSDTDIDQLLQRLAERSIL